MENKSMGQLIQSLRKEKGLTQKIGLGRLSLWLWFCAWLSPWLLAAETWTMNL